MASLTYSDINECKVAFSDPTGHWWVGWDEKRAGCQGGCTYTLEEPVVAKL